MILVKRNLTVKYIIYQIKYVDNTITLPKCIVKEIFRFSECYIDCGGI